MNKNNLKSPNIDCVQKRTIGYFPTLEDSSSSNTLYSFPKRIDLGSIVCINDEIPV